MNDPSKKLKNPLLTAAGPGFSFENYGNTFLVPAAVPVQPDAELDNFVGQETSIVESSIPPPNENTLSENPEPKSSYFTSILSSAFPNFSLSSQDKSVGEHEDPFPASPSSPTVLPTETVPTRPPPIPSTPSTGGAPTSYRLGKHRRPKYAPPPELTSNNAIPNYPPPYPIVAPNPSLPPSPFDSSQNNSSQGSVSPATPFKSIPTIPIEPATPQNTPANHSSLFPSSPESYPRPPPPPPSSRPTESTFTPINAAQVSAKLVNFLAERTDDDNDLSDVYLGGESTTFQPYFQRPPENHDVNDGRRTTVDCPLVPPSFENLAVNNKKPMQYRPVYHHWFYRKEVETKILWIPFSMQDSLRLEEVHNSNEITPETQVGTDGGRYDVDILRRRRTPVYWQGNPTEVRRCSWFYKGPTESRYVPYDENVAVKLEEEYKISCDDDRWNRRVDLCNGEYIVFHSPTIQVHYLQAGTPETSSWATGGSTDDASFPQGTATRPRVVKRGVDEFQIEDGEPEKVDHLLFLVHGIGSVCDLKFRTVEEVVDEFRSISLQLVQSHYRTANEQGIVNRIEVLPISWHATLHSEDTGIDKKLRAITLESIPKLRHFTNDTLLDILFYTSPVYCQTIMRTVGNEMNRLHATFESRNPEFEGGVYLGGHSLGSLILFDLLCHQKPHPNVDEKPSEEDAIETITPTPVLERRASRKISYMMGEAGTGQPFVDYPSLNFAPRAFFALGSPIGMFVTVRGIDTLGKDFALPTCPAFFNIFHPFDPVAYRVEALIDPEAANYRPTLIPHHKGRKRMHLELKETMARVGTDLKQKFLDSVRNTWNSVYQLAMFHRTDNQTLEQEIDRVVVEQMNQSSVVDNSQQNDDGGSDLKIGNLNGGRRIDYVLQEAPFEYINEYIFALTSHVCYWESEDTMLLMLKEIYGSTGIQTDAQLPQQTMSIERVASTSTDNAVGPPPLTGFVKKT